KPVVPFENMLGFAVGGDIMDARLLTQLFGTEGRWHGPCTVVVAANASIQTTGVDAIVQSGTKVYAPRLISGRISADAACLYDSRPLPLVQAHRIRQATGEALHQQTLVVVAPDHVAVVEFPDTAALKGLGLEAPPPAPPPGPPGR